ncbi:hypothetical protein GGR54DRAFT_634940 [Hypoxylon sp. NC1633]|nr:hypothetical protein GGR54DRAFT_634940 [Hypoxylon sp. NC1633]
MTTLATFNRFGDLPKELRILIWEYHFEGSRLHVIHPAPESQNRNPMKEVLLFQCTVLDSATNHVIQEGCPPSSLINREAHDVALSCSRVWSRVSIGMDLVDAFPASRYRLPIQFPLVTSTLPPPSLAARINNEPHARGPVYVDWERDMLYLCVTNAEQAFWSLRTVHWRDRVQKLAVLVPQSEFDRAIPFGPTEPIRETLEALTGLKELLVVLLPQTDVISSNATIMAIGDLPRDSFGFVPYVNYLQAIGLTRNHILYARTAMSFREALKELSRKVTLERVVDVDLITGELGYCRRTFSSNLSE